MRSKRPVTQTPPILLVLQAWRGLLHLLFDIPSQKLNRLCIYFLRPDKRFQRLPYFPLRLRRWLILRIQHHWWDHFLKPFTWLSRHIVHCPLWYLSWLRGRGSLRYTPSSYLLLTTCWWLSKGVECSFRLFLFLLLLWYVLGFLLCSSPKINQLMLFFRVNALSAEVMDIDDYLFIGLLYSYSSYRMSLISSAYLVPSFLGDCSTLLCFWTRPLLHLSLSLPISLSSIQL